MRSGPRPDRRLVLGGVAALPLSAVSWPAAAQAPAVPPQPFLAHGRRVAAALAALGEPIADWEPKIDRALAQGGIAATAVEARRMLDAVTLLSAVISP